jgi:pimeloyl-ACP methyl ester carboxylesterase
VRVTRTFEGADGTPLAYHDFGDGEPLVCLPGGPMQASAYLGDLGALPGTRLIRLDLRGTGESAVPADPATYRCDRQVADVEALRTHLGLERVNLAAHSAGAAIALLWAIRHPDRVLRLVLITPTPQPVGLAVTDADRRAVVEERRNEAWFAEAYAAFERVLSGAGTPEAVTPKDLAGIAPFRFRRWDERTRERAAWQATLRNADAAAGYYAPGAFDPAAVRAALANLATPVLLIAGEHDVALPPANAAEYAGLFRDAELAVLAGGCHEPWDEDPAWFAATVAPFTR